MLGTENTLRSGHLLLVVLVGSSILMGISYMNEMYKRIQLQTDIAIVERQIKRVASERSVIQHRAAQLQMKLEAANHDRERLLEKHEFQLQQQYARFQKEKQELLESLSIKEEEVSELKDQYESLKVHFESLHFAMEQVEKNQSKLLEKFATQSTRCMNVISMMGQLCNKSNNKMQKILLLFKENNISLSTVTSQSSTVKNKPENISMVTSPGVGYTKSNISSGGKPKHLTIETEVNDLNLEPENNVTIRNGQYNAVVPKITAQGSHLNTEAQDKLTSAPQQTMDTQQSFKKKATFIDIIIKNSTDGNSTKQQNTQAKGLVDSYESDKNKMGNVRHSEHVSEKERFAEKNISLQLPSSQNLTVSRVITNVTQGGGEIKLNLTLTKDRMPKTISRKNTTEETPNARLGTTLNSPLFAHEEQKDKDGDVKEEKLNDNEIHLTDANNEKRLKRIYRL